MAVRCGRSPEVAFVRLTEQSTKPITYTLRVPIRKDKRTAVERMDEVLQVLGSELYDDFVGGALHLLRDVKEYERRKR